MTDQITISREDGPQKGRYVAKLEELPEAELVYSRAGRTLLILEHTEVPGALRGKGVGQRLVAHAVEEARAEGVKLVPLCPFAKAQFERHSDWQDVLGGR